MKCKFFFIVRAKKYRDKALIHSINKVYHKKSLQKFGIPGKNLFSCWIFKFILNSDRYSQVLNDENLPSIAITFSPSFGISEQQYRFTVSGNDNEPVIIPAVKVCHVPYLTFDD